MAKISKDLSILRQSSTNVESVGEALRIIEQIKEVLIPLDHGVGLAAVQIGIAKKVGVIKNGNDFVYLINPEVVEKEEEFIYFKEGCLSFPNQYHSTKRYRHYIIKNQVIEDGKFVEQTQYYFYPKDDEVQFSNGKNDLTPIAVQHEIEHFEGKLIIDYNITIEPIVRINKKVGRNESCICGSKKKYKKCCGKSD